MDVVRSCYSTTMRFDSSSPTVSSPVIWYFCAPGALAFPGAHSFGSANWIKGQGLPDGPIGELQAAPRPWRDGSAPIESTGLRLCATVDPSLFLNGSSYLLTPRPSYPDGYPLCCNYVPGGLLLEGTASITFSPRCGSAQILVPNTITIEILSNPGTCPLWAPFQGQSYVLTRLGGPALIWSNPGAGGGAGITAEVACVSGPFIKWTYTLGGASPASSLGQIATGFAASTACSSPDVVSFQVTALT